MGSRPAAAAAGKLFGPSDERVTQIDTGSAWKTIGYCGPTVKMLMEYVLRDTGDSGWNIAPSSWSALDSDTKMIADALAIDTSNNALGDAPKAKLRVLERTVEATCTGEVRLYNSTLAAAVASSDVTWAYSDGFYHMQESSEFALSIGNYNYKVQARRTAGAADDIGIIWVMLELIPE
jgi:hypothetical protein